MIYSLLDVRADPGFFERHSSARWLIIIAVVALVGLLVYFIWRKRKQQDK